MKKKILLIPLLLALGHRMPAQCNVPITVPFLIDAESAVLPALPDCMTTDYTTFASAEVFKTVAGPIAGFEGNVLAYNALPDPQFDPETYWPIGAKLYTRMITLTEGEAYTLSYRFGNGSSTSEIKGLKVYLMWDTILIASHEDITGTTPQDFETGLFTVPYTGVYQIMFEVDARGSQGMFYLDDIAMESHGLMGIGLNEVTQAAVYPNPAKDTFSITGTQDIDRIEMHTATGQCLLFTVYNGAAIDISAHAAGIYFVTLHSAGSKKTVKLIKK